MAELTANFKVMFLDLRDSNKNIHQRKLGTKGKHKSWISKSRVVKTKIKGCVQFSDSLLMT